MNSRPTEGSLAVNNWNVLHEVVSILELKKAGRITSTTIRKEMATVLQLLDMTEAELSWVTDHLGHTGDVMFYFLE